ncbi:MAG: Phenylacetate-CoA oxygenase/reductase, PaaK subunit [Labilithrix sp.]|nr:Phenylacetate-CoA oxygenase/reductase, PaaK subunit [Labilithrix sp.]
MTTQTAQWSRDLRAIARRLAGRHPPPLLKGHARGIVPAAAPRRDPRLLAVTSVVRETVDASTLVLGAPAGERFAFEPGQFFTVLVDVDGAVVPRNYSASNAPGTSELHLTFKRKEGGLVSPRLAELQAGDVLRVLGPFGSFVPHPVRPPAGRRLVLLAGGSGITPLLSIARTVLGRESDAEVALVVGNRSAADVVLGNALAGLAAQHSRLSVVHVHEEPSEATAHVGRLDRAVTARVLAALGPSPDAHYFVCGPDGMREEVLSALAARGVPDHAVFVERFAIGPRPHAGPAADPSLSAIPLVTIGIKGGRHRTTALPGATLLAAGLAAGLPMPFSCGVGGCGACRVRRISGDIALEEPNCLTPAERAAGYVLACVGRPSGPCEIQVEEI